MTAEIYFEEVPEHYTQIGDLGITVRLKESLRTKYNGEIESKIMAAINSIIEPTREES